MPSILWSKIFGRTIPSRQETIPLERNGERERGRGRSKLICRYHDLRKITF
jgi:hypothetical protein